MFKIFIYIKVSFSGKSTSLGEEFWEDTELNWGFNT